MTEAATSPTPAADATALERAIFEVKRVIVGQDVLLERARRFDVPVIENVTLDDAIGEVLDLVLTGAERFVRA